MLTGERYMIVWSSIKSVKWDISSLEIGNTDIAKCMEVGSSVQTKHTIAREQMFAEYVLRWHGKSGHGQG